VAALKDKHRKNPKELIFEPTFEDKVEMYSVIRPVKVEYNERNFEKCKRKYEKLGKSVRNVYLCRRIYDEEQLKPMPKVNQLFRPLLSPFVHTNNR